MIGGIILKKIAGKLVGKAVSTVFNPFKMYFLAVAVAAVMGAICWYVVTAEVAKTQVVALEKRAYALYAANSLAKVEIGLLNNRIRQHNQQKLADMAREAARLKTAQAETQAAREQKKVIVEELAVSRFSLLEAIQDGNEDLADVLDWDIPPVGWNQLRNASEGYFRTE